jgi:hypothetical protein
VSRDPTKPPAGDPLTVRWFGASWGAPICERDNECDTPSTPCLRCGLPFGADDQGVVQANIDEHRQLSYRGQHIDCHLAGLGCPTGIRERGPRP